MRPQKVEDKALLQGLMSVLRSKGYDGASLNDLAASSGLQKASLYHRFPGGKKEITAAVLQFANEWLQNHVYKPLTDEKIKPSKRLTQVLANIDALYAGGEDACILRALSMDSGIELFGSQIKESMQLWIDGFTTVGVALGFNKKEAQAKAHQVLIGVQGSLVVCKGLNSRAFFESTLKSIKNMYKKS